MDLESQFIFLILGIGSALKFQNLGAQKSPPCSKRTESSSLRLRTKTKILTIKKFSPAVCRSFFASPSAPGPFVDLISDGASYGVGIFLKQHITYKKQSVIQAYYTNGLTKI